MRQSVGCVMSRTMIGNRRLTKRRHDRAHVAVHPLYRHPPPAHTCAGGGMPMERCVSAGNQTISLC